MSLSPSGQVSGTPTNSGHFNFTVRATDSASAQASVNSTLGIYAAMTVSQPCAGQCNVEEGCTICGAFGSAGGGLAPYKYSIVSGFPPNGMGVNGLKLTGAFPPPGPVGQFAMGVQVTDQFGASATVNASWYIFSHIVFTVASASCTGSFNGAPNSGCTNQQLQYSGGTPNGTPTATISQDLAKYPALPAGTTATANGGVVTFTMPSPGCSFVNGYFAVVTVVLIDQSRCGPGNCTSGSATITIRMGDGC
jgi:hypothetical protein